MRPLGWIPVLALMASMGAAAQLPVAFTDAAADQGLPDSPGVVWSSSVLPAEAFQSGTASNKVTQAQAAVASPAAAPCLPAYSLLNYGPAKPRAPAVPGVPTGQPCPELQNPYKPFLNSSPTVRPLTSRQKGKLAIHDVKDPFNLLTIAGTSAYFIGTTPHNPYGPGMRGFGYNAGVSLSQDVTGEFIGTYLVCSVFHQDPRYFRMPHAPIFRRIVHAVGHVAIAQGDNGRPIPNYANFITSAASAEITNVYVPGVATDPASTTERIFGGFLTEPIGTLIAEFLPDLASHVHVNIVILQRYINQISAQNGPVSGTPGAP
jgi:hypothetical protein